MTAIVTTTIASGFVPGAGEFVLLTLIYLVLGLLPVCGASYLIYFLLTLPMRRNERARMFLDLLELGLKDGRTPEAAIMDAAASRDRSPGARFHLLAAWLEKGDRLSQALDRVPRLLPPEVNAMLKSGERIGHIQKVLPAGQRLLNDGVSQTRGALNYLILLAFAVTPFAIAVPIVITTFVLPKYREVFSGMLGTGGKLPAFTEFVFAHSGVILSIQIGILVFIWLAALFYIGGPRMHGWIGRILPGFPDWLMYQLPWRRKRMQRDFTAMLALLLDAEMPEGDAVRLAAEASANLILRRRAAAVAARMQAGTELPRAIHDMDATGELSWRLSNALRRRSGFLRALAGWHDSLDAKAFQMEQAAAQLATAALVLLNGLVVAGVVIGVFLALISLMNRAVLW